MRFNHLLHPVSYLRRFPAWLLLCTLALLALAAALLWLPPADQAQAQAGQTVPADWALVPDGIGPGDSFRLLFVTSATRNASSSDIADYNAHAQSAAGSNESLKSFKGQFRALISTSSVDARDNTATTGTGVPIHWLGGEQVADDYADLYDKSWDSVAGRTESGSSYTGLVWTGGNKMGYKSGRRYAGAAEVRMGDLGDATRPLSSPTVKASGETYPIYSLSPVFTVAEPEPPANSQPQFDSDTAERSIDEDAATGANVGTPIAATDADEDDLTYGLSGSDAFSIDDSGQITVQGTLDYETQVSYSLTVAVSDGKNADGETDTETDDTIAVTISVVNVDEAGTVSFDMDPPMFDRALTAALKDPDGSITGATWTWEESPDGEQWYAIPFVDAATNDGFFSWRWYLRATVNYTDGEGPGKTASATTASPVVRPPPSVVYLELNYPPSDKRTYRAGETIAIKVTFDQAVTVTGQPRLAFSLGVTKPTTRLALYDQSYSAGRTLVFVYKVKADDKEDIGIRIRKDALERNLNGGSIANADGIAADNLELPAVPKGFKVDGKASPPYSGSFASVSAGNSHNCGVKTDGSVACWGSSNNGGELTPPSGSFASVSAAGLDYTCGVKTDGSVACWGYDYDDGRETPPSGSFASVSAGQAHACGVKTDGSVACWGYDYGDQASPPSGSFASVSAASFHSCGVRTDGSVACWGGAYEDGAVRPPSGSFASVSVGERHACGVKTDGSVACWWSIDWDEEGWGEEEPYYQPSGSFASVSAGSRFNCGVKTDGSVACWVSYGGPLPTPSGSFASVSAGYSNICGVKTDGSVACWWYDPYIAPPYGFTGWFGY